MQAIFIDRDGTLIEDTYYNTKPVKVRERVVDYIKQIKLPTTLLIIVTNQSGIGRNLCTEKQFYETTFNMLMKLTELGLHIDDVYYCPHAPEDECSCRKPSTGMLDYAAKRYDLDLLQCMVMGDNKVDKELAKNTSCFFEWV